MKGHLVSEHIEPLPFLSLVALEDSVAEHIHGLQSPVLTGFVMVDKQGDGRFDGGATPPSSAVLTYLF